MRPESCLYRAGNEAHTRVGSQRGSEILLPDQDFQTQAVAHLARERERFVGTAAERTIKFRVVRISAKIHGRNPSEGDAIHLVQRALGVAGSGGPAKVRRKPDLVPDLDSPSGAESLEQIFIEQRRAYQVRIERRNISEVVV